jgi:hypothetical protein
MRKQNRTKEEKTKHELLKQHYVYVIFLIVVLIHRASGYTYTFTSYFISEYNSKITNKTTSSNDYLNSSQKNAYVGNIKPYVSARLRCVV